MKKNYVKISHHDLSRGPTMEFRWGVSRGRDTYGYNICSLYVYGEKVSSCNGGGYDMRGWCLGEWMQHQFSEELKSLDISKFYGCREYKGKIVLDGACGMNSMQRILEALGYSMRYVPTKKKDDSLYILETVKVEVKA